MNVCVQNDEMESLQTRNVIQFLSPHKFTSRVSHTAAAWEVGPLLVWRSLLPVSSPSFCAEPWRWLWGAWRWACEEDGHCFCVLSHGQAQASVPGTSASPSAPGKHGLDCLLLIWRMMNMPDRINWRLNLQTHIGSYSKTNGNKRRYKKMDSWPVGQRERSWWVCYGTCLLSPPKFWKCLPGNLPIHKTTISTVTSYLKAPTWKEDTKFHPSAPPGPVHGSHPSSLWLIWATGIAVKRGKESFWCLGVKGCLQTKATRISWQERNESLNPSRPRNLLRSACVHTHT